MKVPFTWKPTGWFAVGVSRRVPRRRGRPLKYFGQDLVAYRTEEGELHVLDAHCLHLGAHLGHHGKVSGDCVECPYHGWGWGPDGENKYIPYEDKPNVSKRLRAWPVDERHEWVFVWHDPHGRPAPLGDARPVHRRRHLPDAQSSTTGRTRSCRSSTSGSPSTRRSRWRTAPTPSTSTTCTAQRCTHACSHYEIDGPF